MHFIYKWRKKCRFLTVILELNRECSVGIENREADVAAMPERPEVAVVSLYNQALCKKTAASC